MGNVGLRRPWNLQAARRNRKVIVNPFTVIVNLVACQPSTIDRRFGLFRRANRQKQGLESSANRQIAPFLDRPSGPPNRHLIVNRFPVIVTPAGLNPSRIYRGRGRQRHLHLGRAQERQGAHSGQGVYLQAGALRSSERRALRAYSKHGRSNVGRVADPRRGATQGNSQSENLTACARPRKKGPEFGAFLIFPSCPGKIFRPIPRAFKSALFTFPTASTHCKIGVFCDCVLVNSNREEDSADDRENAGAGMWFLTG